MTTNVTEDSHPAPTQGMFVYAAQQCFGNAGGGE